MTVPRIVPRIVRPPNGLVPPMTTAGDGVDLHCAADHGLGREDPGYHDEAAQRGEQALSAHGTFVCRGRRLGVAGPRRQTLAGTGPQGVSTSFRARRLPWFGGLARM